MSLSLAFLTLGMLQNLWGRPSACGGLSGRPDGLSITYRGFSTVRGSSMTRPSRRESAISKPAQADVDVGRRNACPTCVPDQRGYGAKRTTASFFTPAPTRYGTLAPPKSFPIIRMPRLLAPAMFRNNSVPVAAFEFRTVAPSTFVNATAAAPVPAGFPLKPSSSKSCASSTRSALCRPADLHGIPRLLQRRVRIVRNEQLDVIEADAVEPAIRMPVDHRSSLPVRH